VRRLLPGMMFVFRRGDGEASWLDNARRVLSAARTPAVDRAVHDLGFLFFSTYLRWARTSAADRAD